MPLFKKADPVNKKMKILVWGQPGTGKTVFSLGWPGLAVIDTERGTDMYAGKFADFDVIRTADLGKVLQAIEEVERSGKYNTLVVDSITNIYEALKAKKMRIDKGDGANMIKVPDWNLINALMRDLYRRLNELNNVHVIVTAAEADLLESDSGGGFRKIGVKPDVDKAAARMFDFSIRMLGKGDAEFIKSRGFDEYPQGTKVKNLSYSTFTSMIAEAGKGTEIQPETEEPVQEPVRHNKAMWTADFVVLDVLGNKYMADGKHRILPIPPEVALSEGVQKVLKENERVLFAPDFVKEGEMEARYQAFKLHKSARVMINKVFEDGGMVNVIQEIE